MEICFFVNNKYKDMGEDYESSKEEDKQKRYEHVLSAFKSLVDVRFYNDKEK